MKYLLFIMITLSVILLTGCPNPVLEVEQVRYKVVKNAMWETVKRIPIVTSREIISDDIYGEIEVYNEQNIGDFLRVYDEETVPDIEHAPSVTVFVCNPANYNVIKFAENIPRKQFADDIELWKYEARAKLLFIDHVPPMPIVVPPPSMYAWYALYVIDGDGQIVFEDHCGYNADESWGGQWIIDAGWRDADHYKETTRNGFNMEVMKHPGWRLIERQIYTVPVVEPVEP